MANMSASPDNGGKRDKRIPERETDFRSEIGQANSPPRDVSPYVDPLTAEQVLERYGSSAQMRFEGVMRVCLVGADLNLVAEESWAEGRLLVDLIFPSLTEVSGIRPELSLIVRNEAEARTEIGGLTKDGREYEVEYYWVSERERQRLVAMLPKLKAEAFVEQAVDPD